MKAKDGSIIELVDNRISDADISSWNSKPSATHEHSASDITSGILATARGGTGTSANTTSDLTSALINSLSTGSNTPSDADYYVSQYANGGTKTNTFHRRPVSALWNYIKGKISTVLGLTATDYAGKAATAGTADFATSATNAEAAMNAVNANNANSAESSNNLKGYTYASGSNTFYGVVIGTNTATSSTTRSYGYWLVEFVHENNEPCVFLVSAFMRGTKREMKVVMLNGSESSNSHMIRLVAVQTSTDNAYGFTYFLIPESLDIYCNIAVIPVGFHVTMDLNRTLTNITAEAYDVLKNEPTLYAKAQTGVITAENTKNVGSAANPVYISNGIVKACSGVNLVANFNGYMNMSGTLGASTSFGGNSYQLLTPKQTSVASCMLQMVSSSSATNAVSMLIVDGIQYRRTGYCGFLSGLVYLRPNKIYNGSTVNSDYYVINKTGGKAINKLTETNGISFTLPVSESVTPGIGSAFGYGYISYTGEHNVYISYSNKVLSFASSVNFGSFSRGVSFAFTIPLQFTKYN